MADEKTNRQLKHVAHAIGRVVAENLHSPGSAKAVVDEVRKLERRDSDG